MIIQHNWNMWDTRTVPVLHIFILTFGVEKKKRYYTIIDLMTSMHVFMNVKM